jgi:hypothetical protein
MAKYYFKPFKNVNKHWPMTYVNLSKELPKILEITNKILVIW